MNIKANLIEQKIRKYSGWFRSGGPVHSQLKLKSIRYLKAALELLEKGLYGICVDCEEAIPPKRMDTVPGAIRCVKCQSQFDGKDK